MVIFLEKDQMEPKWTYPRMRSRSQLQYRCFEYQEPMVGGRRVSQQFDGCRVDTPDGTKIKKMAKNHHKI